MNPSRLGSNPCGGRALGNDRAIAEDAVIASLLHTACADCLSLLPLPAHPRCLLPPPPWGQTRRSGPNFFTPSPRTSGERDGVRGRKERRRLNSFLINDLQ